MGERQWYVRLCITRPWEMSCPPPPPRVQSSVTPRTPSFSQITPCLEAVALILLIVLVPDPPRGAAEKQGELAVGDVRSSWCEDIRYLGRK